MAQKNGNSNGKNVAAKAGLGLGLAAAAIAGAYYLYGSKEGAKRRSKIRGWTLRAKGEVLEKLETLKEVNEDAYNKVVDAVADKYKKAKGVDMAEVMALANDLKRHWSSIRRQMQGPERQAQRKGVASRSRKAAPKKASK